MISDEVLCVADWRHSHADIRDEAARLLENESKGSKTDVARSVSPVPLHRLPNLCDSNGRAYLRSILDSLNHPNVVMLYDKILDKEEQKIYIVMEVSYNNFSPHRYVR
jgi:hypothetical protein